SSACRKEVVRASVVAALFGVMGIALLASMIAPRCAIAQWSPNGAQVCNLDQVVPLPGPNSVVADVQIARDGSSGTFVVWSDSRNNGYYDIYVQHLDALGQPQLGPGGLRLSAASGNQRHPHIIPDAQGNAIVCWEDNRNGNTDI